MADTDVNAATLTVTITEALAVGHDVTADERDFAQTMTHEFTSIANVSKRILKLANTNLTKIASFSTAESVGIFKRADVKYIRVTNLDGSDNLQVGFDDDSSEAAYQIVAPATSVIFTGTKLDGTSASANCNVDVVSLRVKGVAGHQVELFIASV